MIVIKVPCRILPKSTGLEITSRICKVYLNLIYRFCHNTKLFQLNIIYIIDDLIITYGGKKKTFKKKKARGNDMTLITVIHTEPWPTICATFPSKKVIKANVVSSTTVN